MFVTIAIMFGLLLLVPIFVDFASLHFSHRVSQTGADTAAHAAAVEYALSDNRMYTRSFRGECGKSPHQVAEDYLWGVVKPLGNPDSIAGYMAYSQAARYARLHQSELVGYDQRYESHTYPETCQLVAGTQICALEIYAKTRRPVPLIYESAYGESREAPAEATAEVYLDPAYPFEVSDPIPCGKDETRYIIDFYWVVRLIDTRR